MSFDYLDCIGIYYNLKHDSVDVEYKRRRMRFHISYKSHDYYQPHMHNKTESSMRVIKYDCIHREHHKCTKTGLNDQ